MGVHIANGVDVDQAAEAASLPAAPGTPSEGEDASISKLLGALRSHSDKHAAEQAAFKAVMQTPQLQVGAASTSFTICRKPWQCIRCRLCLHHAPAYDLQGSRSICLLPHVLSRLQITILHVSICCPCKAHTLADPTLGLQRSGSGSDSESEAFKDEKRKRPEVEVPSLKVINTLHCLMCA